MKPEHRVHIETERLVLEPFAHHHAQEVTPVIGHELVASTTSNIPHPYTERDAQRFADLIERSEGGLHSWLLRSRAASGIIGGVGLHGLEGDSSEFGYWIGVEHWGKGYATEGVIALIEHAFRGLGLRRLHACYFTRNPASRRVMEKAGCTPCGPGTCGDHVEKNGVREAIGWMGITYETWHARDAREGA